MTQDSKLEPLVLSVPDLTEALAYFTQRLGFHLDMILPADAPQFAVVSGQGLTLRLTANAAPLANAEPAPLPDQFIINRLVAGEAWHEGRAGMQYRDLIPGRLGGRFIASHIRIPGGGDVPDYVHYHKVRFQMIYCKAGWVRVVYEDQGPPFVLTAGDCVLQPPEIRHRVLASSPGLEVIEIGCPALHETWVDHELSLPTPQVLPARLFNGQRFVRHHAREAHWLPWRVDGFEARDTGIAAATDGLADARVVRATKATTAEMPGHTGEFLFVFVLQGEADFESHAAGKQRLQAGDSCVIPAGHDYVLRACAGLEMLEVSLPAKAG
ncbi:MAG: cupin domain-containing protein [Acidobacteria bacterium]|nr:cupin domain-containing protein [Acidobacteriota bacterium]MBI3427114.1 cupin domain-containing protein [Acidobacteriota bacterium]